MPVGQTSIGAIMESSRQYITAHAVIHEILPRLRTTEALVNNTLEAVIETT